MSFYGSMKVSHINAATEPKLEAELRKIEIKHDAMIKVINVYKSGTGYTAWYYHDYKKAGMPPKKVEPSKKKAKKKVTKKVS